MAGDEDYELLPHNEVEQLKTEISKLKKNPLGDSAQGQELADAINQLNANIKRLIDIFVSTQTDLAKEYSEHNPAEDLKNIRDQNEEIAKGIVALADMIKESKQAPEPVVSPPPQYQPQYQDQPIPKVYPSPYADATFSNDIPPPANMPEKKKGLFRR